MLVTFVKYIIHLYEITDYGIVFVKKDEFDKPSSGVNEDGAIKAYVLSCGFEPNKEYYYELEAVKRRSDSYIFSTFTSGTFTTGSEPEEWEEECAPSHTYIVEWDFDFSLLCEGDDVSISWSYAFGDSGDKIPVEESCRTHVPDTTYEHVTLSFANPKNRVLHIYGDTNSPDYETIARTVVLDDR